MKLSVPTLLKINKAIEQAISKKTTSTTPFLYGESIERLNTLKAKIDEAKEANQVEPAINSLGQFAIRVVEQYDWTYSELLCEIISSSRQDLGLKATL
jgi:hypothetical protein